MAYTPVEIRHVRLRRGVIGYGRRAVDRLLAEVTDSYEDVWRERADLADRLEHLDVELARYKELEELVRATLVSAERAAHELRGQAKREADTIVTEAKAEARAIERDARVEHEELLRAARRIRSQLKATLDALEDVEEPAREAETEPEDDASDGPAAAEAA